MLEGAVLPQVPLLAEGPVAILAMEIFLLLESSVRGGSGLVLLLVELRLSRKLDIKLAPLVTHLAVGLVGLHPPRGYHSPANGTSLVAVSWGCNCSELLAWTSCTFNCFGGLASVQRTRFGETLRYDLRDLGFRGSGSRM